MTNLITIHPGNSEQSYGYETSQLSRVRVANYLGWGYLHILTSPQLQETNWKSTYTNFGFSSESLICVPNWFSDCGHDKLSVKLSDLEERFKDGEISTIGEYVTQVKLEGSTWFFTSNPYLERTSDGILIWYNRDGSISMKAKYFDIDKEPTPVELLQSDYLYFKEGKWYTSEDLLIKFLLEHVSTGDLIIRDQHQVPHLKLWRFVDFKGLNYYEYIHHNVLIDLCANLRRKTKYLVASEVLTSELAQLGYQVTFCPPIMVDSNLGSNLKIVQNEPKKFCFVGNMSENKRVDWVLSAFAGLEVTQPNLELHLYGELDNDLLLKLPNNVIYHGYVPIVPYDENQVYISCSKTELFANACVEALSQGLVALLSDVDIAHRFYNQNISNVFTFKNIEELKSLILKLSESTTDTIQGIAFVSKNYGLASVASIYYTLGKRGN